MANKNPVESASKWQRRTSAAAQDYKEGVGRVTESPTAKAAERLDKALAGYQEAVSSGRMARALQDVTLPEWQAAASGKGVANFATGVNNVSTRKKRRQVENYQLVNATADTINGMPDNTIEERIAKSRAFILAMYTSKRE